MQDVFLFSDTINENVKMGKGLYKRKRDMNLQGIHRPVNLLISWMMDMKPLLEKEE